MTTLKDPASDGNTPSMPQPKSAYFGTVLTLAQAVTGLVLAVVNAVKEPTVYQVLVGIIVTSCFVLWEKVTKRTSKRARGLVLAAVIGGQLTGGGLSLSGCAAIEASIRERAPTAEVTIDPAGGGACSLVVHIGDRPRLDLFVEDCSRLLPSDRRAVLPELDAGPTNDSGTTSPADASGED